MDVGTHPWSTHHYQRGCCLHKQRVSKGTLHKCLTPRLVHTRHAELVTAPEIHSHASKGTVMFAYVDKDGEVTKKLSKEAIYMFGSQVQFITVGNKPIQQQCSKCWVLGHKFGECKLGKDEVKCFVCGGKHHRFTHNYECAGKHKTPGVCNCKFKCMLCGDHKHNAVSVTVTTTVCLT